MMATLALMCAASRQQQVKHQGGPADRLYPHRPNAPTTGGAMNALGVDIKTMFIRNDRNDPIGTTTGHT